MSKVDRFKKIFSVMAAAFVTISFVNSLSTGKFIVHPIQLICEKALIECSKKEVGENILLQYLTEIGDILNGMKKATV